LRQHTHASTQGVSQSAWLAWQMCQIMIYLLLLDASTKVYCGWKIDLCQRVCILCVVCISLNKMRHAKNLRKVKILQVLCADDLCASSFYITTVITQETTSAVFFDPQTWCSTCRTCSSSASTNKSQTTFMGKMQKLLCHAALYL